MHWWVSNTPTIKLITSSRFGRNTVGLTQNEKNLRAQFTQQVLQPIAFALLTEIERVEGWDRNMSINLDTASVFKGLVVTENVLSFLSSLVPEGKKWVINATTLDFDVSAIESFSRPPGLNPGG